MRLCVRIVQDEHGQFTATCPSLPGCTTHGESREDAYEKLTEAIRGYMAAVNNFIPEELTQEVVEV